jgi:hypothetical protein
LRQRQRQFGPVSDSALPFGQKREEGFHVKGERVPRMKACAS